MVTESPSPLGGPTEIGFPLHADGSACVDPCKNGTYDGVIDDLGFTAAQVSRSISRSISRSSMQQ